MRWREAVLLTLLSASAPWAAALPASAPALAAEYDAGPIHVADPWARATARPGMTGGGFMAITNRGTAPDRLVAITCAEAQSTELHRTVMQNGVMKMLPVQGLLLPPGGTVRLAPGGYHLMLIGLAKALSPGQATPCTLHFAHAGPLAVTLAVQGAGAMSDGTR